MRNTFFRRVVPLEERETVSTSLCWKEYSPHQGPKTHRGKASNLFPLLPGQFFISEKSLLNAISLNNENNGENYVKITDSMYNLSI